MEDSYFIRSLMKIGSSSELDPEEKRRRTSAVFILLISILAISSFSIYHFFAGNYLISILNWAACFSFLATVVYIRKKEKASFVYWIISVSFGIICSIITAIDRTEIAYLFWAFTLPPIAFSILGHKKGIAVNIVFLFINLFLMSTAWKIFPTAPYSGFVVVRFAVIYVMLTLIIFAYEASQQILINYIQKEKDKFEKASMYDALTGLSNRLDIMTKIEAERERQLRLGNPFTLILGDVDNFKDINDTYGHDSGDYVLKKIAGILKDQVRGIDHPSRIGGEEFLIMLVETDINDCRKVAERIRKEIESTVFSYRHANFSVAMTFGLSAYQGVDDNVEECIKRADQALYIGKSQGKNRVIAL